MNRNFMSIFYCNVRERYSHSLTHSLTHSPNIPYPQGYCGCTDEDSLEYTEACGWDGGDCEGVEELCEGTIEPSPTEEPPADDTEEAFSNPSGGTPPKSFEGLAWVVLALANAIGI